MQVLDFKKKLFSYEIDFCYTYIYNVVFLNILHLLTVMLKTPVRKSRSFCFVIYCVPMLLFQSWNPTENLYNSLLNSPHVPIYHSSNMQYARFYGNAAARRTATQNDYTVRQIVQHSHIVYSYRLNSCINHNCITYCTGASYVYVSYNI